MRLATLEAQVTLNTTGFNTGVQTVSNTMGNLRDDMTGLQTEARNTGGILEGALGHALGDMLSSTLEAVIEGTFELVRGGVELASSMEEVTNVVDVAFGDNVAKIYTWSQGITSSFGVGELAALKYAGTMGSALSGMGVGADQVYEMSTSLVELAGDMASFYNLSSEEAFRKIMSGITGEMEPLKQLGIVMDVANLKAHALAMGIETAWKDMDTATQTQVRYSYLMQTTANAQGDFARTSESYANQMRLLEENIANLQISIGEALLPVLTDLVTWFNGLFGAGEDGAKAMGDISTELGKTYATIDSTAANALALVEALAKMEEQGVDTADEQGVWNALLKDLSGTLPEISGLIDKTTGSINGGTAALSSYVQEWRTTQHEMAVAAALQKYQAELAAQAQKVADIQLQLKIADMTDAAAEAERMKLVFQAADYFFPDQDEVDYAQVVSKLQKAAKNDDSYATWILSQMEMLEDRESDRKKLEQDLLAANAELEVMNTKFAAMQAQIDAIMAESKKPPAETGGKEPGDETAPAPVHLTVNVSVDGQEVSAILEPRVKAGVMSDINWQIQQKMKG